MATTTVGPAAGTQFTNVRPEAAQTPTTMLSGTPALPNVKPEGAGTPTTDLDPAPPARTQG